MTNKEELKQRLEVAKVKLEEKGFHLGEEGELMDLFPAMKQYEYAFQSVIEDVYPDKLWWQVTNYWDIFQDSIMSGKSADEVIQDILDHVEDDGEVEEIKDEDTFKDIDDEIEIEKTSEEDEDALPEEEIEVDEYEETDESLKEDKEDLKITDSIFELVKDLDEGE